VNEQEREIDQAEGSKDEKIKKLEEQLKNLNWFDRHVRGMGPEIEEQIERLKTGKTKSYGPDFGQAGDPLYKDGEEPTQAQRQIDKDREKYGDSVPEGSFSITPQTQAIPTSKKTQMSGKPQVIIPLDHARTAGSIPDTTGGNKFSNSNATGADGREREHQDPAARMLQEELAKKGINAKIVKPEDFASYEEYDAYLKKMSEQGVVSVPLHFDAIQEGGGTGFLTRTRAGDSGDSSLASPINDVLSDFASKNPDLGSYKTDTAGNATVNMGAASPTALVELGEMVRWEEKHGKNFTQSDKFRELIKGVAGGVVEGGNLKPGSDAEVTSRADVPPPAPVLPPPQKVSVTPPRPPGSPTVSVIAAAVPAKQNTSGSMRRNSTLPSVGAVDQNNDTVTITKGVYSIVA
jgi:hypothetical protein